MLNWKTLAVAATAVTFASEALATEWNVSVWGKRRAFTEHIEKIAELVSAKTNGGFTMNVSYGGLSKNTENLDGISIGAFEMAQICAGYHEDKNPTLTVLELPFLGVSTFAEEVAVSNALYAHPAVQADLARWNAMLLMPSPMPQYNLVGRGDDGIRCDPVQVTLLDVDQGRGALDLHQRPDQSGRHPPARDGEVVDGPLGLGLPPRLDRYRHRPQRVVLDAESGRLEGRWVGRAHEVRSTPDGLGSGHRVKRVRATAVSG